MSGGENGNPDWRRVHATVIELQVIAIGNAVGTVSDLDGLLAVTDGETAKSARAKGKGYAALLGTLAGDLTELARELRQEAETSNG